MGKVSVMLEPDLHSKIKVHAVMNGTTIQRLFFHIAERAIGESTPTAANVIRLSNAEVRSSLEDARRVLKSNTPLAGALRLLLQGYARLLQNSNTKTSY